MIITKTNLKQIAQFAAVGVANTLADFVIFNLLFSLLGVPLFIANVCAVSLVMLFSLHLNRKYVFKATDGTYSTHGIKFFVATIAGLYIIQNIIIFIVLHSLDMTHSWGGVFANAVVQANVAKAIGVVGSASWNFVLYKLWVFKSHPAPAVERPE